MPFGRHKGKAMANVPAKYLLWFYNNADAMTESAKAVRRYILDNLDVIKKEAGE